MTDKGKILTDKGKIPANQVRKWEILDKRIVKGVDEIVKILLKNRGIETEKEKKDFFLPC